MCIEVCSGPGFEMEFLANRERITSVGIDLSKSNVKQAKSKTGVIGVIQSDAEKLPITANACDIGFVYSGLHHLPNPYKAISELGKVSKDVVVLIDITNPLITRLLTQLGLFRIEEHTQISPNRLSVQEVIRTFEVLELNYKMLPCIGYLQSNRKFFRNVFSTINSVIWRLPSLGLLVGNVIIAVGFRKKK